MFCNKLQPTTTAMYMQLLVPQPQGYFMFAVSVQEYRLINDSRYSKNSRIICMQL